MLVEFCLAFTPSAGYCQHTPAFYHGAYAGEVPSNMQTAS
jgi:hypothetical protein